MGDNNSPQMGVATRVLIMLYGAAIVALGAYPLRQDFAKQMSNLRQEARDFRKAHRKWFAWADLEPSNTVETKAVNIPASAATKSEISKNTKPLDKITKEDRRELGDLVNQIAK